MLSCVDTEAQSIALIIRDEEDTGGQMHDVRGRQVSGGLLGAGCAQALENTSMLRLLAMISSLLRPSMQSIQS